MKVKDPSIRQDIINVARDIFCKRGYADASMSQIAQKAHTAVGNLYTYFPNKEAILEEVIGDTPEKVHIMLAQNYKEIIKELDLSKIKAFYDMLSDCSEWFNEID